MRDSGALVTTVRSCRGYQCSVTFWYQNVSEAIDRRSTDERCRFASLVDILV